MFVHRYFLKQHFTLSSVNHHYPEPVGKTRSLRYNFRFLFLGVMDSSDSPKLSLEDVLKFTVEDIRYKDCRSMKIWHLPKGSSRVVSVG